MVVLVVLMVVLVKGYHMLAYKAKEQQIFVDWDQNLGRWSWCVEAVWWWWVVFFESGFPKVNSVKIA
jgi:hypothetical protein